MNYDEYAETARRCSKYDPKEEVDSLSNLVVDSTSCLNCHHLTKNNHCELDLIDEINDTE